MGRLSEQSCIKCCPIFCLKCIFFGWIGCPIHCCRCMFCLNPDRDTLYDNRPCHGVLDSETWCLPLKRHCNVNGRNRRFKLYIPWGILELLSFLCSFLVLLKVLGVANFPFAMVNSATLLDNKVSFNDDELNLWTGSYEAFRQKTLVKNKTLFWKVEMSQAYTMLNRDMVENWNTAALGNNSAMHDTFKTYLAGNNVTQPYADFDDVIVMSHHCFCKGYFAAKLDKKTCMLQTQAGYCKMLAGAALAFVDLPAAVTAALGQAAGAGMKFYAVLAFFMSLSRLVYFWWKPRMLSMPGTQWLSGFWTFFFLFVCGMNSGAMINQLGPLDGIFGKYFVTTMVGSGAIKGGGFWALNMNNASPLMLHLASMQKTAIWGWRISLLTQYLSEHAYCTDCTHYSMLDDNLSVIKKKQAKKLAKKNSIVFGTKQI